MNGLMEIDIKTSILLVRFIGNSSFEDGEPTQRPTFILKAVESLLVKNNISHDFLELPLCSNLNINFSDYDTVFLDTNEFQPETLELSSINTNIYFIGQISKSKYKKTNKKILNDKELTIFLSDKFDLKINNIFLDLPMNFSDKELKEYQYFFPVPDRKVYWGHLLLSYGCPHSCTFCTSFIRETSGKKMEYKNLAVIKEELQILESRGVTHIAIADDDISADRSKFEDILNILSETKLGWTAHLRIDEVDKDLIRKMSDSGSSLVRFGVESFSCSILKYFNKTVRTGWTKKVFENLFYCSFYGVPTISFFIFGSPKEGLWDLLKNFLYIQILPTNLIQLHMFRAYSDTVESKNRHLSSANENHYSGRVQNKGLLISFITRLFFVITYLVFYLNPIRVLWNLKVYYRFILSNLSKVRSLLMFLLNNLRKASSI